VACSEPSQPDKRDRLDWPGQDVGQLAAKCRLSASADGPVLAVPMRWIARNRTLSGSATPAA